MASSGAAGASVRAISRKTPVQQAAGQQAEISTHGTDLDFDHAGALQQVLDTMACEAKVIVRRLVHFPLMRHDGEQRGRGRERARGLAQNGLRLTHVLQRNDVDGGVEAAGGERQPRKIGHGIQAAVIPSAIAHGQVHAAIALAGEVACVADFARAGVQDARARRQAGCEAGHRILNGGFEMQNATAQPARQVIDYGGAAHGVLRAALCYGALRAALCNGALRASIMMVDPAWQAASSSVKGRTAASKLKCARSLSNLAPGVSGKPRTRRAMGSSVGARLVARPAGLSRREKYLRRSTWKPAAANSASRSRARKSVRWRGASTPFHREPSRRNCQQAALGTCTINRPLGFSRTRAAAR